MDAIELVVKPARGNLRPASTDTEVTAADDRDGIGERVQSMNADHDCVHRVANVDKVSRQPCRLIGVRVEGISTLVGGEVCNRYISRACGGNKRKAPIGTRGGEE